MKLYIILKSFYFCNHSCDIHIFDVLYRLYKCSSMHVKTLRFPKFSNSRHCRRYHSSYMKDRRGGFGFVGTFAFIDPPIQSVPLRRCIKRSVSPKFWLSIYFCLLYAEHIKYYSKICWGKSRSVT